jgi:hypothetical protein
VSRTAAFEQFDRAQEIRPPSGRLFGIALSMPFTLAGAAPVLRGGPVRWWALAVSAALLFTALARPAALDRVAAVWTRLLRPVHAGVTIVAMGLLFFLVVTPAGWLRRALVRDPLRLRFDPQARTYWQERQPSDSKGMVNQF